MQIYRNPSVNVWDEITRRPICDHSGKREIVRGVMDEIREKGDEAVHKYTRQFDQVDLSAIKVTVDEIADASALLSSELKAAIQRAAKNIETFHVAQKVDHQVIETMPGVKCWLKSVPIEKVGLYIPGGSAPLFSTVLMLGIPARIAGCRDVVLCTPPDREGRIHPAILYAAAVCGITEVFKVGGIQAIGAMAYGTATVPKVDKIFGPGNSWVTAAKQFVGMNVCAIDMPAGPSEVAVMADETAIPSFVAADLLSQAEHGPDSQVILLTTDDALITKVMDEIEKQIQMLPRSATAAKALDNSRAIVVRDQKEMIALMNFYAPEHLIISTKNAEALAEQITNAGSVFIGNYSPESAGDYASGTNHTLPTNGWAKSFSGIGLDSFCKKITFQHISHDGILALGPVIEKMAEAEQLFAHQNAATLRMKNQ